MLNKVGDNTEPCASPFVYRRVVGDLLLYILFCLVGQRDCGQAKFLRCHGRAC